MKKFLGASVMVGMLALSGAQLSAAPDQGKNFTVSDSPQTTVFNLQIPSSNRHIHDLRRASRAEPAPAAPAPKADDCDPGLVTDYIDKYLVRLEKSAPATVALNAPFAYEYTVIAKDKVSKVVVEEQIPAGAKYVSSQPKAQVSGSNVTWTLHDLEKGERVPLKLTVEPTEVADLSSCAQITAYPSACVTTQVGVPELAITKTTPDDRVLLGAGVPWHITVTNMGNFCAYDVVVTDTLPSGVAHESGQSILTTDLGTLAPGESRDIRINTQATGTGEHCNVVLVESSNAGSADAEACIVVVEAGLDVVKEGTPMQFLRKEASYEITVTNTGDVPIQDVVVTDTVPAPMQLLAAPGAEISGNTATWTTSLGAGESKSFELKTTSAQEGTFCNQVSASSATFGLHGSAEACTEWRGFPALLIEVIDTVDPLLVGERTTYIIQVTNQGTAPATNVKIDTLAPDELSVVSAAGVTPATVDGKAVSFAPYEVLEPKQIIEYRVIAEAVATGDARFTVELTSDLLRTPATQVEPTQVY